MGFPAPPEKIHWAPQHLTPSGLFLNPAGSFIKQGPPESTPSLLFNVLALSYLVRVGRKLLGKEDHPDLVRFQNILK